MKTYIKPNDLTIKILENEIILNKGFLHKHSLTIDKLASSKEFVLAISDFEAKGYISFQDTTETNRDFNQLAQLNLINMKIENDEDILFVVEDCAYKYFEEQINQIIYITKISDFLDDNEITTLNSDKDTLEINQIKSKYNEKYKYNHIFLICSYRNQSLIRAVNKLTNMQNKLFTVIFFDNNNIIGTHINHGETGCFECLENQIVSKFSGSVDKYFQNMFEYQEAFDMTMYGFIMSIVLNEIKNIQLYGDSTLNGNVLHFYLPTYEYNFDFNKRQSSCSTCSTVNNILFREQNMKSVNILKKVLEE